MAKGKIGEGPFSSHAMRGYRDEFRKTFKAGDIVTGTLRYRGRPLLITAIGERRFLFINVSTNRNESVCMIETLGNRWEHWQESKWPDNQYAYAVKRAKDLWDLIRISDLNNDGRECEYSTATNY
jgi:hypothetical protein